MSTSALDMRRRLGRGTAAELSRRDRAPGMAGMARGLAQAAAGQTNARVLPTPNPTASAPLRSDPQAFSRQPRFGPSSTGAGAPSGLMQVPTASPLNTPAMARSTAAPATGPANRAARSYGDPIDNAWTRRAAEISRGGVPDSYSRGIGPSGERTGASYQGLTGYPIQPLDQNLPQVGQGPLTPDQIGQLHVEAIRQQNLGGARSPGAVQAAQNHWQAIQEYNNWASQNGQELIAPPPGIQNLLQSGDVQPSPTPQPNPTWPWTPDNRFPLPPPLSSGTPPGYTQPPPPPAGGGGQTPPGTIPPDPPPDTGGRGGTGGGGTGGGGTGGGGTGGIIDDIIDGVGGGTGGGGTGGGTQGPPPLQGAPQQGLAAPGEALGADVRTYDASLAELGPEATVEGRLENLFTEGNPLLARARQQGLELANSRGLLNSSIGAEIGVAALMDQALNIATPDAAAMQQAVFRNQDAINSALQYNTEAQNFVNRADQAFRQQWAEGRTQFGEQSSLQRQRYDETLALQQDDRNNRLQLLNQEFDRRGQLEQEILQPGREAIEQIRGDFQREIQNSASNGAIFQGLMTGAAAILQNDRFNEETQAQIISGLASMTREAMELNSTVSGFEGRFPSGGFGTGELAEADYTITNPDGSTSTVASGQDFTLQPGSSTRIPNGGLVTSVPEDQAGPTAQDPGVVGNRIAVFGPDGTRLYRQPYNADLNLAPGQYVFTRAGTRITG